MKNISGPKTIDPMCGRHEDHPGAAATDCPEQYQVNARYGGGSMNGYGCGITGGHCLPWKCPLKDEGEVSE